MSPSNESLRAAEHHAFSAGGRRFVFDVNAFTIVDERPVDAVLLAAGPPRTRAALVAAAVVQGFGAETAEDRLDFLRAVRLLLAEGEEPHLVELAAPSTALTVMVNVSQRCNLTCAYCYVAEGRFDYKDNPIARMSADTAASVVERTFSLFPDLRSYGFHYYGGEPLLNFPVIRDIAERAEAAGAARGVDVRHHITTNGTLLTEAIADFMAEHEFEVYLSIDGDASTHDQERRYRDGRGSYADVERALGLLRARPSVHLIGSSVIHNGASLAEAIAKLEDHGVNQCKAERVRLREGDRLALAGEAHSAYLEDLGELAEHYLRYLRAGKKPVDFRLSSKILQLLARRRRDFFCPAGSRMWGVSASGDLYPCALHVGRPQSRLGSLAEGIDSQKQAEFRARFSPAAQEDCRTCWTRHLCGGGCSAMTDRFGHEDCASLRRESEAAISVYHRLREEDETLLYALVSPALARWVREDTTGADAK